MKRILAIGIILLFIGTSISSSTGFNVEKKSTIPLNGKTLYVGGSGPNNYTKIQDAIDNASDGDTVFVYDDSSPYKERVVINRSISLIGENRDTTVIDGKGQKNSNNIKANFVSIINFTIRNFTGYYVDKGGILISSNNNYISNCTFTNNRKGITITGSNNSVNDCYLYENKWDDRGTGIFIWGINNGDYNRIDRCIIYNNNGIEGLNYHFGIWLSINADHNTITRCTIIDHLDAGIGLYGNSNHNLIFYNNFAINNPNAIISKSFNNSWDNGMYGNYWDNYRDRYPNANQTNGIWDTPYNIKDNQFDNYPFVSIIKIHYPNMPSFFPVAWFEYEPSTPIVNETVRFNGNYSFDFQNITQYQWNFGDGAYGIGRMINHSYSNAGDYTITLNVTNEDGKYDGISRKLEIKCCGCVVTNLNTGEIFNHIQSAIDDINTRDNHTLFVPKDQICYSNIKINKIINLIGEDIETTVIDARGEGCVIDVKKNHITISGFTIQNSGKNSYGIKMDNQNNNIIVGNKLINNNIGIYLLNSMYNTITSNTITMNKKIGINIKDSRYNNISQNMISNNGDAGINLNEFGNKFFKNIVTNENIGLIFGSTDQIYENIFSNNEIGVLSKGGLWCRISKNNFLNNKQHATFQYQIVKRFSIPFFLYPQLTKWTRNYWDRNTRGPMMIHGKMESIPWLNFDFIPAREPYDIGEFE